MQTPEIEVADEVQEKETDLDACDTQQVRENTGKIAGRNEKGQFLPGFPPLGRKPKGSRHKLANDFLADLHADWNEHGAVVIETVRKERPHEYLKVVASILPKQHEVSVSDLDAMDERQLRAAITAAIADLRQFGVIEGEFTAIAGREDGAEPGQDKAVQALPEAK